MAYTEAHRRANKKYRDEKRVKHTITIDTDEATVKLWSAAVEISGLSQPDLLRAFLQKYFKK